MVSKPYAAEQIARLAGLNDYPKGYKEAVAELVSALQGAKSDHHAREIIDTWMQPPPQKCPTPADIRMAVYAEDHKEYELPKKNGRCERCKGTGWVSYQRKTRALPGMPERVYDCAAPCSCPAGAHGRKPNEGAA